MSWLDRPCCRAEGYSDPMKGRGSHNQDATSRSGKMWSSHPKYPPWGPPLDKGWWAATTVIRGPAFRRAPRSESTISCSLSVGQVEVGSMGLAAPCSHH